MMSSSIPSFVVNSLFPPIVASSCATFLVFPGFVKKSALQTKSPIPRIMTKEMFFASCKAGPTLGSAIGTQIVAQHAIESISRNQEPSFLRMFTSATLVGTASVPLLVIFNGQTFGQSAKQSLKALSMKQACSIVARETSFLFSLRISKPISNMMKEIYGENKIVEYSSMFLTGAIGSVIGHPADTLLTLWQKKMKITYLSDLMRGGFTKAYTVGMLSVIYNITENSIRSYTSG